MKKNTSDILAIFFIFIISLILCFDLFLHKGLQATFDGPTHITTIAQYHDILQHGGFPIKWMDKFGNYGLPVPLFIHQTTNYVGGLLDMVVNNPVLTFKILIFSAILLSSLFLYVFLRLYVPAIPAVLGVTLFTFAPFRIIDIYVRGDLPELFASILFPLILISLYALFKQKRLFILPITVLLLSLLILTHIMMFVIFSFFIIPYIYFLAIDSSSGKKQFLRSFSQSSVVLLLIYGFAVGITAFYLIPLKMEVKYLYIGLHPMNLSPNHFLGLSNFLDPTWNYFNDHDIFTRGQDLKTGVMEFVSLIVSTIYIAYTRLIKKSKQKFSLLELVTLVGWILIFFLTPFSNIVYETFFFLSAIQFPWRMLALFVFIPPMLFSIGLQRAGIPIILILISFITMLYIPQAYGKNYTIHSKEEYRFTIDNLHSANLNPIWAGLTDSYPIKSRKYDIVSGQGTVTKSVILNSQRTYTVEATTPLRMVDYTFYFPGWKVYIDGQETNIEFQDPDYRGVLTYTVPQGNHTVLVKFTDTKIRKLSLIISIVFIVLLGLLAIFLRKKKVQKWLY